MTVRGCLSLYHFQALQYQQLTEFFVQQAGLGLNDGFSFGTGGDGFMRLNIGTQKAVLEQALAQLTQALV